MLSVVLTEYESNEVSVFINNGKRVELVIPDDVVCFFQRSAFGSGDELLEGSHEGRNLCIHGCAAESVVTAGDNAEKLAVCSAVFGNCDGGVTERFLECYHFSKSLVGTDVGVGAYEAGFVAFDTTNHSRLIFDGLRTVDEGYAAFFCERDCHAVIRDSLHDCGHERNVHGNCGFFSTFIFYKRRFQRNVCRNMRGIGITRNKQIFAECMRRFAIIKSHFINPP